MGDLSVDRTGDGDGGGGGSLPFTIPRPISVSPSNVAVQLIPVRAIASDATDSSAASSSAAAVEVEPVPASGGVCYHCVRRCASFGCTPGLVCMFISCVMFAFVSVVVKLLLNDGANVWLIVFGRNTVQIACGAIRMRFIDRVTPFWGAPERRKWLVMRGVTGGSSIVLYYAAVALIPLTIATVLDFTDPVWTALLAAYVLRERVSIYHAIAVTLCLTGALLVTQPFGTGSSSTGSDGNTTVGPDGSGGVDTSDTVSSVNFGGVLLGLGGAVTASLSYIAMRKIQRTEPTDVLVMYLSCVCSAVTLIPMLVLNTYVSSARDWFLLLLIGVMAYAGQCLQTYGFQTTPAALASTLNYVQLIITAVLAVIIYGEIPNALSIVGSLLIVASTLALIAGERNKRKNDELAAIAAAANAAAAPTPIDAPPAAAAVAAQNSTDTPPVASAGS